MRILFLAALAYLGAILLVAPADPVMVVATIVAVIVGSWMLAAGRRRG